MDTGSERRCDRHYFKWYHALRHSVRQRSVACSCTNTAVLARQPASLAPISRATTPFGTPQSAGGINSLPARLQSILMDPRLYQALQATSPLASPHPHAGQPACPDQYAVHRTEILVGQQE
eukprot:7282079-Pyramimonas_sp.AAC.1